MFCPNCGNKIADDAGFCSNCGQALTQALTQAPAKVVESKPPRKMISIIAFGLTIVAIYACISAAFFLLLSVKNTVGVESLHAEEIVTRISFGKFLTLLRTGNRVFRPTVISTAFGVGLQALYWLIPLFGLWASIGAMMNKNPTRLCVAASIMISITGLLTAAVIPLTLWLIPELKQGVAIQAGVMFEDLGTVSFLWPAIAAAAVLILMIVGIIVTNKYRKWRA